jgi:hypothetical protein
MKLTGATRRQTGHAQKPPNTGHAFVAAKLSEKIPEISSEILAFYCRISEGYFFLIYFAFWTYLSSA